MRTCQFCHCFLQERQRLVSKQAEAQRAASILHARQQQLETQLNKCGATSSTLQKSLDSTTADLAAQHQQSAKLQTQFTKLQQQHKNTATQLSAAAIKLQDLEELPPRLARVSSEAEVCRKEMSTLSGSQAKVHESLQAYLHQEKELRRSLDLAEQHLSHVNQDYAVCQDTAANLRADAQQTKV